MSTTSIVYYPGPWHVGGAESYVLNIARGLGAFGDVAILSGSRADSAVLRKLRLPTGFDPEWRVTRTCNQSSVNRLARDADVFVNCSPWDYPRPPGDAASAIIAYYAPEIHNSSTPIRLAKRAASRLLERPIWPTPCTAIGRYDEVLCVSKWTAELAVRRWGRAAGVFYPAVRPIPPRAKEPLILTVGRIGAGGTRKGHAALIEAFLRLKLDGWRLAVAGAVNYTGSRDVVQAWRSELNGSAVEIIANPASEELESLYGRASLYWHGAGFGAMPGSVGREHFGISVVEAMSAGAVPLAFGGGGVREIVTDGVDGVLWRTLDDLIEATRGLASDEGSSGRLRAAATARARFFDVDQHDRRLHELLLGNLRQSSEPR